MNNSDKSTPRWIVAQEGSRRNYGIPVGFQRLGLLRLFYADIWCRRGRSWLKHGPITARALAGRFHPEIPPDRVISFGVSAIARRTLRSLRSRTGSWERLGHFYCDYGEWFGSRVARELERVKLDPALDFFFGFDTNSLEAIEFLRSRGVISVITQVDPGKVEEDLVAAEREAWPGWEQNQDRLPQRYWNRLQAEWRAAELVAVNSDWSKSALVQQGVSEEKIVVVPIGIDLERFKSVRNPVVKADGPLRVIWLGTVNLRKGIQYLVDAARQLQNTKIEFVIVGGVEVTRQIVATFPGNLKVLGRVTRSQTATEYSRADVFVLPTLSDGFAVTQLEAMALGLPVVTTPNCGRVVTDGVDGFIVPPRDADALAEALASLDRDRALLREMSRQARLSVRRFDLPESAVAINKAALTCRQGSVILPDTVIEVNNRADSCTGTLNKSTNPLFDTSVTGAKTSRWIVAQEGTRESYAIPAAFHRLALLRTFYVDIWCNRGRSVLRDGTAGMRALATHFHPEVPLERIVSFNPGAIWDRARQHLRRNRSPAETGDAYCRYGNWFASKVRNHLGRRDLDPEVDCFFGFNTNCLETLEMLRNRKIFTIVDQVDPAMVEEEIVMEEAARWPGWERNPGRMPQTYWSRIKAEWQAADLVLVNSEWSRRALIQQGVPSDKIIVVPLAIDLKQEHSTEPVIAEGPLKVLWLGNMILRKGIQYLVEAARKMERQNVEFLLAGPLGISSQAVRSFPDNVKVLGRVTRDQLSDAYQRAHVFVMPTLSDGFGVTQLEAMAHALPVVATPNCGRVITNGIDGFIVPPRDSNALADTLTRLEGNRSLLREMSRNALQTVKKFDLPSNAELIEKFSLKYRQSLRENRSFTRLTPVAAS